MLQGQDEGVEPVSENRARPIGVFDSGAGGLTVVGALLDLLALERVVYFGDTAYVPYGPRPPEEIRRFAVDASRFLAAHGAKLIVMGCNMSSAMALDEARGAVDCPVLGTIDAGARSAAEASVTGRIGVAATEGTVASGAYERALAAIRPLATVVQQPCPLLVPAVEDGLQDGVLDDAVARSLGPVRDADTDTLILGCTHYPLLRPQIQRFLGPQVTLIDPALALAAQARELLTEADMLATEAPAQRVHCHASGAEDSLVAWATRSLGLELGPVEQIDIHVRGSEG